MRKFTPLLALLASISPAFGQIEIRIDYTYDTSNFFNTQEKRDAMEAVAKFYGDMINDSLLRIDPADFSQASWSARFTNPSTGSTQPIPGLIVPENVIIVYVGARNLGGSVVGQGGPGGYSASGFTPWFERIDGRGSPGAATEEAADRTDFATWGGSITFDSPRTWNFSQSSNASGTEFVPVALHEMGHVLGIGTATTWDNQLSGGTFTGPAAVQSFGSAPTADGGHFTGSLSSELFGSFSVTHGSTRPVMMLPGSLDTGSNFDVATDLDLAALVDIGWQLNPGTTLSTTALSPSGASFNWNSVSFKNYEVERSTDLQSFPGGSPASDGNGGIQSWSDPSPPAGKAFYRLSVTDVAFPSSPLAALASPRALSAEPDVFRTVQVAPRVVNCQSYASE